MEPSLTPLVPYRKQETGWTCGAASLRMAYASFGLELSEPELWAILQPDRLDRSGVYPARLAWEAQNRGFSAMAVQARRPWDLLTTCARHGIRAVFHQPLSRGSPRRHFSILAQADDDRIIVHDPQFGPDRAFPRAEWLEHWGACFGNFDARPNELIAIADSTTSHDSCVECGESLPEAWPCRACREPISLRPAVALGCVAADCPARLWEQVACPACGHPLTELDGAALDDDSTFDLENPLMPSGKPFQDLNAAMSAYQRKLAAMQGFSSDASVRDVLGKLQESMRLATDKLGQSLDRIEAQAQERSQQVEERRAKAEKKLEEAKKAREETLAKLAAKKAAKASLPRFPQEAEDPHLGAKLRDKLLEEFGTRVDQPVSRPLQAEGSLIDFDPGA